MYWAASLTVAATIVLRQDSYTQCQKTRKNCRKSLMQCSRSNDCCMKNGRRLDYFIGSCYSIRVNASFSSASLFIVWPYASVVLDSHTFLMGSHGLDWKHYKATKRHGSHVCFIGVFYSALICRGTQQQQQKSVFFSLQRIGLDWW